jgi:CheY-like chemotaxis protein
MSETLILLVDDDPDDQELFVEALEEIDESLKCILAKTAMEGYDVLKSGIMPDYIFLDLNLPCINGKQFLSTIKKDSNLQHIPVAIYTTSKLDDDVEETKVLGASFFLTKPARFDSLKNAILYIISEKHAASVFDIDEYINS